MRHAGIVLNFNIGGKNIGDGYPVFIIAEMSGNHGGDIKRAYSIIDAAVRAGADAVKLQTYTPDSITLKSDKPYFKTDDNGIWKGRYLYDLYLEAHTPEKWHRELKEYAEDKGLIFFSSPFDTDAVDFLESLNVPCYKIASFEINDIYLLEYVAETGKPVMISTGAALLEDIETAVKIFKNRGNNNIVLLKCTSSYPAEISDANISMICDMKNRFGTLAGLSDHTLGCSAAIGAACMGACVIEKHITLDKNDGYVDSSFSMTPEEFKSMVKTIREIEAAVGKVDYNLTEKAKLKLNDRRSLFSSKFIKKGELITKENIKSVRPACGLNTKYYKEILGKRAKHDIEFAVPLKYDMFE